MCPFSTRGSPYTQVAHHTGAVGESWTETSINLLLIVRSLTSKISSQREQNHLPILSYPLPNILLDQDTVANFSHALHSVWVLMEKPVWGYAAMVLHKCSELAYCPGVSHPRVVPIDNTHCSSWGSAWAPIRLMACARQTVTVQPFLTTLISTIFSDINNHRGKQHIKQTSP